MLEIEQTVRVPRGDAKIVPFILTDEDNDEPLDVENIEITWQLEDTRTRDDILSLEDNGVQIVFRDPSTGEVQIKIETDATKDLRATDYREVLQVTDSDGDRTTWVGDSTFILTEDG